MKTSKWVVLTLCDSPAIRPIATRNGVNDFMNLNLQGRGGTPLMRFPLMRIPLTRFFDNLHVIEKKNALLELFVEYDFFDYFSDTGTVFF